MVELTFGHGARHLPEEGPPAERVEAAIREALTNAQLPGVGLFRRQTLQVEGLMIEFHVYRVSTDMLHVGTYFPEATDGN